MEKRVKEWSELRSLTNGGLLSYLAGFYIVIHYLEIAERIQVLQSIRFQFLFGAMLAAFSLPKIFRSRTADKSYKSLVRSAFLLIFVLGFYTVFSMDREVSIDFYLDRVIKFSMIAMFILAATNKVDDLRIIIILMIFAWLKIGSEGVLGWLTGAQVWENQGIPRLHGSTASLEHPNSFSGFGVGCLPFCVFLYPAVKSKLGRLVLAGLFLSAIIIVVNTGSRTGYVAVVMGAAFFFYKMKLAFPKKILLVVGVAIVTAVFLPDAYKERFESIFTGKDKEGRSSELRKEIFSDSVEVFKTYPFGVGVHAFPKVRKEMFGRTQDTHNLYMEVLTNAGIVGLIIFLSFVRRLFVLNFKNLDALSKGALGGQSGDWDRKFLLGVTKALIGFLLLRLFLGLFGMDLYEVYWWLILGLTLSVSKLLLQPHEEVALAPMKAR